MARQNARPHWFTDVIRAGLRGGAGAMAMTGMRSLTVSLGLLKETPPEMVVEKELPDTLRQLDKPSRDAVVVLAHWAYGIGGGAVYGALPAAIRRKRWSGPVYGVILWLGFELAVAPALGLRKPENKERLMLAADHLLYGLVLAEMRNRPQA